MKRLSSWPKNGRSSRPDGLNRLVRRWDFPVVARPDSDSGMSCHDLTDFEWRVIAPPLPNKPRGVPRVDDRRVLNGIFRVLRSGVPWRDVPEGDPIMQVIFWHYRLHWLDARRK